MSLSLLYSYLVLGHHNIAALPLALRPMKEYFVEVQTIVKLSRIRYNTNILNTYCRENRRCCYIPVRIKPDLSMNNYILSNKRVITIATMLSFMMLAASLMPSLAPTGAFAQQDIASDVTSDVTEKVNGMLTPQSDPNSNSGEDASDGDNTEAAAAAAPADEEQDASDGSESSSDESGSTTPENAPDSDINIDSASEEDTSSVEEDDFVTVDPIVQNNIQTDVNAGADVALVMDEEDCDEANTEEVQANVQDSDQQADSEGRVGDNSFYVSPKYQLSEQIGVNAHVDLDIVLVEGCNPVDDITQANVQRSDQGVGTPDLSSSGSGTTAIIPANQRADKFAYNIGVNDDYILPVL